MIDNLSSYIMYMPQRIEHVNSVCDNVSNFLNVQKILATDNRDEEFIKNYLDNIKSKYSYNFIFPNDYVHPDSNFNHDLQSHLGCDLTHIRVWEEFYNSDSDNEYALIMEDDIKFNVSMDKFNDIITSVLAAMKRENIGFCKFYPLPFVDRYGRINRHGDNKDTPITPESLKNPITLMDNPWDYGWSNMCYIINKELFLKEWAFNKNIVKNQKLFIDFYIVMYYRSAMFRLDVKPVVYEDKIDTLHYDHRPIID